MAIVPWHKWINYKFGETNPLGNPFFGAFYDKDVPINNLLASLFKKEYEYDILSGTGPYKAVVLKVLSGPQAEDNTSKSARLTKEAHAGTSLPNLTQDIASHKASLGHVRIIAKVPELSPDLPWPANNKDNRIISFYPEFTAQRSLEADSSLASITEGSIVYVDFINKQIPNSKGGNGILIAVHDVNFVTKLLEQRTPAEQFTEPCKLPKICTPAETKNLYSGFTESNFLATGPLIRKIKGKIKTGMYGEGSEQTKLHFDECLRGAPNSSKHKIPGPTPNSKNSFIWVGHLNGNGNGKMDLVDRPPIPRETIIYAPRMLDTTSPIEIKYYLHDAGGFGYPWINGPNTTAQEALNSAKLDGNDFKEKIAPAIKDLIRDNRNFVIVIPEMCYSRGFGTAINDVDRIVKYTACAENKISQGISEGAHSLDIVRVHLDTNFNGFFNDNMSPYIGNYIESNTADGSNPQNLIAMQERYLHTFTRFGSLPLLHNQVVDVLRNNIALDITVGYTSILADGLGALSLSAAAALDWDAERSLSAINLNRIDFVENGYDKSNVYSWFIDLNPGGNSQGYDYLNPTAQPQTKGTPSIYLYYKYLARDRTRDIEFNYISNYENVKEPPVAPSAPGGGTLEFFTEIGKRKDYMNSIKPTANGLQKRFGFNLNDNANNKPNISFYIAGPPTGLQTKATFSMVNDQLSTFKKDTLRKVGLDFVPNHAQKISAKQKSAALSTYKIEQDKLNQKIENFDVVLNKIVNQGLDSICKSQEYKLYCTSYLDKASILKYGEGSLFLNEYQSYIANKERFYELLQLAEDEAVLIEVGRDKSLIEMRIVEYNNKSAEILSGPPTHAQVKESLNRLKRFDSRNFTSQNGAANIENINVWSEQLGRKKAIEKTLARLNKKNKRALSECSLPEKCKQDLITLGSYNPTGQANIIDPAVFTCDKIKIEPLRNYAKLSQWIPYYPKKDEFTFDSGIMTLYGKESKTKINLQEKIETFKLASFKYKARRTNNTIIKEDSPLIWSCLAPVFEAAWEEACRVSGYVPFMVTDGIRGSADGKQLISTEKGLHVGSLGLSINVDPFIAPYAVGNMSHSVFTGAFTPGISENEELFNLGVFSMPPNINKLNWQDGCEGVCHPTGIRKIDNLIETHEKSVYAGMIPEGMPESYEGPPLDVPQAPGASVGAVAQKLLENYDIIDLCRQCPIVGPPGPYLGVPARPSSIYDPKGLPAAPLSLPGGAAQGVANPTLWAIVFCEKSGARWGNGQFLRRSQNGVLWGPAEKKRISEIYDIEDIYERIKSISWPVGNFDNHSYFQFWRGPPIVTWKEINEIAIARGLR
jgi:hypothetical protein